MIYNVKEILEENIIWRKINKLKKLLKIGLI